MVTVGTHLNADRLLKTRPLIIEICCQLKNSSIMMMSVSEDFTTRLTRRVSLVEQETFTLPEHLSSPPVFSGVRVTRSLVLYLCFVDRCLSFCTFFWYVLLRCTDSDCHFGIFRLFFVRIRVFFFLAFIKKKCPFLKQYTLAIILDETILSRRD